MTRRVLLRCDNTGDLYPVTAPSPIPHAFLVSQYTWHQRLGHPGGEVLCRLVSSNFISYNKEKPPVLCHACQLGKHVRLPFVSSSTVISSCFDIIHSDVWTSPIPSLSGFKYYVLGYRCLDLHTNKIIISRHVTFDETVFPYGSTIPKSTSTYTFLEDTFYLHHTIPNLTLTTPNIRQTDPLPHQQHPTKPAAQQSSTTAPPTPASPSSAQIHSPVQQPSPMAQHTPIQIQFSPTTVSHQTTTISDQHAPAIIQNPPVNPNPDSVHPMVMHFCVGTNHPTERLNLHVSLVSHFPKSYRDAFNDPNWQNAMRDEYTALIQNKTCTLVPRPPDTNIVRCMWLFCHKYMAYGTLSRYKARLVVNGSTQLEGVDVDETFSLVVKLGTIRIVLSLVASRHWPIHQLDVKNAFLHGNLSETVYMHQPPGFWDSVNSNYMCLLQRRWDSSLFIYRQGTDTAYLLLYVDDIVLTTSSASLLQQIIGSLHKEFAMTDLGSLNYFLGISVTRDSSGLFLSQKKYASEILERAHMVNCNPSRTPVDTESKLGADVDPVSDPTLYRSLAGSLQYLTFTRPDISYVAQQVCLYLHDPREPHFFALKRILRYVQGTLDYGLQLFSSSTIDLVAYSDADWAGCPTTRRSTSGYCVFLGNSLLSWSSKCQSMLLRSSAEAEYRCVANAVAETCWLRNLLRGLHTPLSSATLVYCDNVSAVYLSSNRFSISYADIFTKGLPSALFEEFRSSLSVRCPPAQTAGEC
ncbi:ribonuclease H-like domain-containing protein [Tanacetum coccineum]